MRFRASLNRMFGHQEMPLKDEGDLEAEKLRQAANENATATAKIIRSATRDIRQAKRVIGIAEEALRFNQGRTGK